MTRVAIISVVKVCLNKTNLRPNVFLTAPSFKSLLFKLQNGVTQNGGKEIDLKQNGVNLNGLKRNGVKQNGGAH